VQSHSNLRDLRHIKMERAQLIHMGEDFPRRAFHDNVAIVHDDDTIRQHSFLHEVSDIDDGQPFFLVQAQHGACDFSTAVGIEHGCRLVENDRLWAHGDDAGDGDALLLPAAQVVWHGVAEFFHLHQAQRFVDALKDRLARKAEIFRPKRDLLEHGCRHELVIRILENHPHTLQNIQRVVLVAGVQPVDEDAALRWQQESVQMLGQRRFSTAVAAQHRDVLAIIDAQVDLVQRAHFVVRTWMVDMCQVVDLDHAQTFFLDNFSNYTIIAVFTR